ncbi:MAG TPA: thioredoxin domain-containing protein [Pyrinomonadaceae bacterium]|nr:thioredoxin domain-containing protein [Pyrinomonadaceae bacterium]
MTFVKSCAVALFVIVYVGQLSAQTRRRDPTRTPAATTTVTNAPPAQPAVTPAPAPAVVPSGPVQIAIVNGQTISSTDLEPSVRQEVESTEQRITEARRNLLDVQINTILLEDEARRRRISSHRLYETEVTRRIPTPTAADIKKFLDDNRAQFEGVDPAEAAPQAEALMHDQLESKLADDLVKRLRKTIPVVMGVDINTLNLPPQAVVATVGGQPLTAAVIDERLKPVIFKIRFTAYQAAKAVADQTIDDILLIAEANRQQVTPEEMVRKEISEKVKTPTDAEVEKFYNENKARINQDLSVVRNQLVAYLQNEDRKRLEKELSARLRKGADVRWLISEPPAPVLNISVDDDPSRGDANAPVTLVEFTDFQCPACAAMQPVLEEVLQSYGNKVRFVVRDFPLAQHENARKAAEAANAANAQGKFFEYAELLFKRQKALDVASLKKYATEIGLNRPKFDAALDSGTYQEEVKHDIEDGQMYGVGSTPTIFINGLQLTVLSADGLREAIDRALGQKKVTSTN